MSNRDYGGSEIQMMYDRLQIIDNLVEPHVAEIIDSEVRQLSWKYDYNSRKGGTNKHWHIQAIHTEQEMLDRDMTWIMPIWQSAMNKVKLDLQWERVYLNAHTHGVEPLSHTDDGDYTLIYYPRLDWEKDDMGGTIVLNEVAEYKGNRLICFPAKQVHQAMPVSRNCHKLRTCIVFKTLDKGGQIYNSDRLEGYKEMELV